MTPSGPHPCPQPDPRRRLVMRMQALEVDCLAAGLAAESAVLSALILAHLHGAADGLADAAAEWVLDDLCDDLLDDHCRTREAAPVVALDADLTAKWGEN